MDSYGSVAYNENNLSISGWWSITLSNTLVFPEPELPSISIQYAVWIVRNLHRVSIMFSVFFSVNLSKVIIMFIFLFLSVSSVLLCTLLKYQCHVDKNARWFHQLFLFSSYHLHWVQSCWIFLWTHYVSFLNLCCDYSVVILLSRQLL